VQRCRGAEVQRKSTKKQSKHDDVVVKLGVACFLLGESWDGGGVDGVKG
jgi:hypothetical protein